MDPGEPCHGFAVGRWDHNFWSNINRCTEPILNRVKECDDSTPKKQRISIGSILIIKHRWHLTFFKALNFKAYLNSTCTRSRCISFQFHIDLHCDEGIGLTFTILVAVATNTNPTVAILTDTCENSQRVLANRLVIILSKGCWDSRFEHVCAYWRCKRSNQNERNVCVCLCVCVTYHNPVIQHDRSEPLVTSSQADTTRYNCLRITDSFWTRMNCLDLTGMFRSCLCLTLSGVFPIDQGAHCRWRYLKEKEALHIVARKNAYRIITCYAVRSQHAAFPGDSTDSTAHKAESLRGAATFLGEVGFCHMLHAFSFNLLVIMIVIIIALFSSLRHTSMASGRMVPMLCQRFW